jgi:hypothetical protein
LGIQQRNFAWLRIIGGVQMYRSLFIALTIVLAGCASAPPTTTSSSSFSENFRLNTATDGRVYRINNQTGEVWEVVDGALKRIGEPKAEMLQIGRKYYIENNFSVTLKGSQRQT